jgi:photosystem II stability/assembly factor-like uncharacterized protein
LYNSKDFGKNWKLINLVKPNTYIWDISCPDTNTFYLGLRKGIYKSLNKGKNPEKITIDSNAIYDIKSISMLNQDVGVACYSSMLVTKDSWKTYKYEKYWGKNDSIEFSFSYPRFKNDSILNCIIRNTRGKKGYYFGEFNINTFEYDLIMIVNHKYVNMFFGDMSVVDKNHIFLCGKSDNISGGSGNDAIFKSADSGKTWRRVLDLYSADSKFNRTDYQPPEFGLQSISFKDSLTGIAVGQFGKILYTYDGGESWIYETKLHDSIYQPPTMQVRYAGSVPIIATLDGQIYRMIEDNIAPKPEDTITISGRVWEGKKGQPGIPIIIGNRVTMTDSNGYYKFTKVKAGKQIVYAVNKYYDGGNPKYDYKPFDYTPKEYNLDLTGDTSGIDFNAIDLRTFYSVSGEIITSDGKGLKDIPLTIGDIITISTIDGKFKFPKIESKRNFELIPYSKEYTFTPSVYSITIDKDLDTFKFKASIITSVVDYTNSNKILISPNPASDYITISLSPAGGGRGWTPEIFNIFGEKESTPSSLRDATPQEGNFRIDVSNLAPGVYFIKIGDRFEKFIKM